MRIGLVTTLNTNIGDDFIRGGICLLLNEIFNGKEISFVSVNKHNPLLVYPNWHPVHLAKFTHLLPRGQFLLNGTINKFAPKLRFTRFDTCDLIVQCGAPVLWNGCSKNEWAKPLWHEVIGRLSRRIPVLNLAAGSAYPWTAQPVSINDPEDAEYLQAIHGYCRLTTVRDRLAEKLWKGLEAQTSLLPCTAFLAAGERLSPTSEDGPVLINYMNGGGHFEWDQGIDSKIWQGTVIQLIGKLRDRHELVFLCHNQSEYELANALDPTLPRILPKTPEEYFSLLSSAKTALCNRMHATVGLAGLGIPSIAVCTDTRLLMVKELGLPTFFVKDVGVESLEAEIERLLEKRFYEKERLLALKVTTRQRYLELVQSVL